MIVILCSSFMDVKDAYDVFVSFLEWFDACIIKKEYTGSYCVETVEDIRYIFIDYRMKNLFNNITNDFMDVDEFFDDLADFIGR